LIPGTGAIGAQLTSQGLRGIIGGLQGGYNYQWAALVFGAEADIDWGNVKGTAACVVVLSCNDKINSFGDVGGRIGFVADKALIYVKGGWAWADQSFNINSTSAFAALTSSRRVVAI
jgi:outer membrane immunogenic protein